MSDMRRLRIPKPGTVLEYWRAAVNQPAISRAVVADVLSEAGLGYPDRVRNLPNGWRSSVVMAAIGSSRFVVRRYPDRWTDAAVTHEHSLLLELQDRGFPAPRLVDLGERSFVRTVDGGRYSVQSFEEGIALTGFYLRRSEIRRLQRQIGRVLADFQDALRGFIPQGRHHLGIDPATGRLRRDLDWHLRVIDDVESAQQIGSALGDAAEVATLRNRLVDLDRLIDGSDLPVSIVHGDFGLHNIIFRPSGEALVHDFELSRFDIRLLDLVGSLSRLRPEFRLAFLTGFKESGGVSAVELDLLEPVWEWHRIRGAIQSAEAYSRVGGDHRVDAIKRRLAEASRIRSGLPMVRG